MKHLKSIVHFDFKKSVSQNVDYKVVDKILESMMYKIMVSSANKNTKTETGSKSCVFKSDGIIQ